MAKVWFDCVFVFLSLSKQYELLELMRVFQWKTVFLERCHFFFKIEVLQWYLFPKFSGILWKYFFFQNFSSEKLKYLTFHLIMSTWFLSCYLFLLFLSWNQAEIMEQHFRSAWPGLRGMTESLLWSNWGSKQSLSNPCASLVFPSPAQILEQGTDSSLLV